MRQAVPSILDFARSAFRNGITLGLGGAAVLLLGFAVAWAQAPLPALIPPSKPEKARGGAAAASRADGKPEAKPSAPSQLREGTELVDQLGRFKIAGDRALFVPANGNRQLTALENLNLERVIKVLSADPEAGMWVVTGLVTEYRGNNYLLIRRAVLKSRGKP